MRRGSWTFLAGLLVALVGGVFLVSGVAFRPPSTATTARFVVAAEETGGLASAAKTCSVNSFTGATRVTMADGSEKPIRDVKVGDKVLATDPETGETAARPVTKLIVHSGKHTMVDVHLADGSMVTATDRHPFWDATTGEFIYAIDLRPGDKVREIDGTLLAVAGTRVYDEDVTAYNLTVDGIHTYYAGTTPVLVHNSCGTSLTRDGEMTNGDYTVSSAKMGPHMSGSTASGKSQFLFGVDAHTAALDAASYADEAGLWLGNKATVFVENGPVGVLGRTGELTDWINVYRTDTGFIYASPGGGP